MNYEREIIHILEISRQKIDEKDQRVRPTNPIAQQLDSSGDDSGAFSHFGVDYGSR